jgi:hypothetical protein
MQEKINKSLTAQDIHSGGGAVQAMSGFWKSVT